MLFAVCDLLVIQNRGSDFLPICFAEESGNICINIFVMSVLRHHQFRNGFFNAPVFKNDTACGDGTAGAVAAVPAMDQ